MKVGNWEGPHKWNSLGTLFISKSGTAGPPPGLILLVTLFHKFIILIMKSCFYSVEEKGKLCICINKITKKMILTILLGLKTKHKKIC